MRTELESHQVRRIPCKQFKICLVLLKNTHNETHFPIILLLYVSFQL